MATHPARILTCCLALVALLAIPDAAAPRTMPYGQGVLWRIDRAGVAPSHLFGTIHLTDPRVLTLPAPVRRALDGARKVVIEVLQTQQSQAQMAQRMVLRDGRTLDAVLGPKLFGETIKRAQPYGFPQSTLRALKPWAAMTLLALPPVELQRQAKGVLALDRMLVADARKRGVPVGELETVAEQLDLFDGLEMRHQVALLRQLVRDHHRLGEIHANLVSRYLARDVAAMLADMLKQSAGDDPALTRLFWDRFIVRRNRTMARRMQARLNHGGAFIAVGAAHLPGEDGIVALLIAAGWRAQRAY